MKSPNSMIRNIKMHFVPPTIGTTEDVNEAKISKITCVDL